LKETRGSITVTVTVVFAAFCDKGVFIYGITHNAFEAIFVDVVAGLADAHVPADVEDHIRLLA